MKSAMKVFNNGGHHDEFLADCFDDLLFDNGQ